MNDLKDITKHLFYSAWILTIVQMIRVAAVTIIAVDFQEMTLIADVAFDCALVLFGIGLIRLGRELENYSKWIIAPVLLFTSAGLDILNIIFTYTNLRASWTTEPLVFLNLSILVCQAVVLVTAFIFLKINIDNLAKNEIIERKGQYFLALGFLVYLVPSIIGWYGSYVGETSFQLWQENLAFYVYLFATFLILLGFLGLTSTMKILQVWSHGQELEIFEEEEKDV
ncbi:MAG: hypothetical protein GOP50_10835 [Candidatus Heimdallarchaeota archaeon]|nr:hypothetical protein [Candidatus Heimdallarchaeota archaeon]